MFWQLSKTPPLPDDNGLFWRIHTHAGAQLLPGISTHVLVAVARFPGDAALRRLDNCSAANRALAKQVTGSPSPAAREHKIILGVKSVPLARHPAGFPRLVAAALAFGVFVVALLWFGFSVDYATTRDVYFTVAIAHVLAEVPFLLEDDLKPAEGSRG